MDRNASDSPRSANDPEVPAPERRPLGWTTLGLKIVPTSLGMALSGEVDMATSETLLSALQHAGSDLPPGPDVVLDLADLTFIDSNGVRAIAQMAQAMASPRRLVIRSAPLSFLRIAEVLNLDREPGLLIEGLDEHAED